MDEPDSRLVAHLRTWLGQWPPTHPLTVVGEPARDEPGWDGAIHDVIGVSGPTGAVISVPPEHEAAVRAVARDWERLPDVLPSAVGRPTATTFFGVMRWCTNPTALPDAGIWVPATDHRLPNWLKPFAGDVLVALDGDRFAAGVGLKRHNRFG